jgi:hypothetical protein
MKRKALYRGSVWHTQHPPALSSAGVEHFKHHAFVSYKAPFFIEVEV